MRFLKGVAVVTAAFFLTFCLLWLAIPKPAETAEAEPKITDGKFRVLSTRRVGRKPRAGESEAVNFLLVCADGEKVLYTQEEAASGESVTSQAVRLQGSCNSNNSALSTDR